MPLEISGEITPEKNEGMEPKQKQHPVVDVTGDKSKVWSCKEKREYYLAIKKNDIISFAATWVDLEILILSEVSQEENDKFYVSLICEI